MAKLKHDLATVLDLVQGPGDSPLHAWLHDGMGTLANVSPREAASAIEAAVRLKRPDRVAAAQAEASNKDVRKAAGAAAHKLRSAGITVPDATAKAQWSMGEVTVEVPPPVTMIGMPDPDGWVPFVVVSFGSEDTVAFAGMASASQGHRDCYHNHIRRSDARKLVHDARRGHELQEMPPHTALHLLDRAFTEGGARPHEWDHFANLVGAGVVTSARVLDPLRDQTTDLDPIALAQIEPLLERRNQLLFGVTEDKAQAAVSSLVDALASVVEVDDTSRTRRIKSILDDAADSCLDDDARRAWILAMDVVTIIARGRQDGALQTAARQTSLALQAGNKGRDVPFVRASVERQLSTVVEAFQRAGGRAKDVLDTEEGQPAQ